MFINSNIYQLLTLLIYCHRTDDDLSIPIDVVAEEVTVETTAESVGVAKVITKEHRCVKAGL